MINLALVDDHILLRNGLADLLKNKGFNILFQVSNGKELQLELQNNVIPQIILMDINMPIMDGFETTKWLSLHYSKINVLALSMYDTEINIIKMLRAGAVGYILKYAETEELINAIETTAKTGFYYSDLVNYKFVNDALNKSIKKDFSVSFTEKEITFINFCCSELSYKEIAEEMNLSPKTIENYREQVFLKLDIHTRVGLVMFAIKTGIVKT